MSTLPISIHDDMQVYCVAVVGTTASPITDANTARPVTMLGNTIHVVYWLCANGVTPTNATGADLIWNAP